MALDQVELAIGVRFDDERLYVKLASGAEVSAPLAAFPRLLNATPSERQGYVIEERGTAINWPKLDEDIGPGRPPRVPEAVIEELVGLG